MALRLARDSQKCTNQICTRTHCEGNCMLVGSLFQWVYAVASIIYLYKATEAVWPKLLWTVFSFWQVIIRVVVHNVLLICYINGVCAYLEKDVFQKKLSCLEEPSFPATQTIAWSISSALQGAKPFVWRFEPRYWQRGRSDLGGDTRWPQRADFVLFQGRDMPGVESWKSTDVFVQSVINVYWCYHFVFCLGLDSLKGTWGARYVRCQRKCSEFTDLKQQQKQVKCERTAELLASKLPSSPHQPAEIYHLP